MIANALASCAQVALLVAACAGLPRLLGLRSPSVQYLFWRVLLAVSLLLPLVQPRRPAEMVFVPAPAGAALPLPGTDAAPAPPVPAPAAIDWWRMAGLAIAAGAAVRLTWLAAGILRLRRMRRRAGEEAAGFDDLGRTIGVAVPILWSRELTHPVTFGVLRPVVLLPIALASVDETARRAVVAHELHHVKRRDWLWVLLEEVVRSLLWFHPAVWWLISRVQLARETVVDELSILTTNARRAYLDTLLAFADDTGLSSSPAFSARRHLFHRVMLLSKEGSMSSIRIAAASCVLAVALAGSTWGAVSAFPLYGAAQLPPPPPPPAPPRDPLSPEAYYLLGAQYRELMNRDASLTAAQKVQMILKGIAAEDRALELRPDYAEAMVVKATLLRAQANLTSDKVERDRMIDDSYMLAAQAARLQSMHADYTAGPRPMPPPPPPPPPPGGSGEVMVFSPAPPMPEAFEQHVKALNPVRVGGGVKQPAKIHDVKPEYPPIARQAGVQGVVILEVLIDADGNVAEARVLRSVPLLDSAALDAVQQWKFAPSNLNGVPTAVMMTVTVNFTLQ